MTNYILVWATTLTIKICVASDAGELFRATNQMSCPEEKFSSALHDFDA
jgi:hypothetical protein